MSDDFSLSIRCVANTYLSTKWGKFRALGFERRAECKLETAIVLIMGDVMSGTPLVRSHSECLTDYGFRKLFCCIDSSSPC
jgi:GTP cyclohydrolase II